MKVFFAKISGKTNNFEIMTDTNQYIQGRGSGKTNSIGLEIINSFTDEVIKLHRQRYILLLKKHTLGLTYSEQKRLKENPFYKAE